MMVLGLLIITLLLMWRDINMKIDDLELAVKGLQDTTVLVLAKLDELKAGNNDARIEAATLAVNTAVGQLGEAIK